MDYKPAEQVRVLFIQDQATLVVILDDASNATVTMRAWKPCWANGDQIECEWAWRVKHGWLLFDPKQVHISFSVISPAIFQSLIHVYRQPNTFDKKQAKQDSSHDRYFGCFLSFIRRNTKIVDVLCIHLIMLQWTFTIT